MILEGPVDVDMHLQRFGLVPHVEDLPQIRRILQCEADTERSGKGKDRVEDLALLCSVQLFSRGQLEDVLRIWDAKCSGMDLGCALGVQLLCGPGLQETKAWLAAQHSEAATAALTYISQCELAGDFDEFEPSRYLESCRGYFAAT